MTNTSSSAFSVSRRANLYTFEVGHEKTRVLVVDNLMSDVEAIRQYAFQHAEFEKEIVSFYPGLRAMLPKPYIDAILQGVLPLIMQQYNIGREVAVKIRAAFLSMVTKAPEQLEVQQRIPHYDNTLINSFAIMHYLNPGQFGGTGYFRHKATGVEVVTNANRQMLHDSVEAYFLQNGEPDKQYIRQSNGQYALTGKVEYQQNRLLVYPSGLLHSGLIETDRDVGDDPQTARLSANIFVELCVR